MKRNRFTLAGAIALAAVVLTPTIADAQNASRARRQYEAPPAAEVLADARVAAQRAQLSCQVTEARWLGRNASNHVLYEVACQGGPGFLVLDATTPQAVPCIANNASVEQRRRENPEAEAGALCELEANTNLTGMVRPFIDQAGITCTVDNVRWVGQTPGGQDRYEVGCAGSDGYWLEVNTAQNSLHRTLTCLQVVSAGGTCGLTTAEEQAAWVAGLAAGSGRSCAATQARYVGQGEGRRYYEVACSDGPGFMVRTGDDNSFQAVVECADATGIGGGCALTDAATVAATAGQRYQQMLADTGVSCAYQAHGTPRQEAEGARRLVVEYQCSDRPWGLVAFLPQGGQGELLTIDCLAAAQLIGGCQLTSNAAINDRLTQLMNARGRPCTVAEFRRTGRVDSDDPARGTPGGDVVEMRCQDGSGFIAVVRPERNEIGRVQTCETSARNDGEQCQLG